mmetsp:Transcript_10641/g.42912  ORF Transcript_10641/g.42912 Transcript_10641/m.42912 type:complete len:230 (+) Transcript_10641:202-891(+)
MGCAPSSRPTGSRAARATGRCTTSTSPPARATGTTRATGYSGPRLRRRGFARRRRRRRHQRPKPSRTSRRRRQCQSPNETVTTTTATRRKRKERTRRPAASSASANGTAAPGAAAPSRTPPQSPRAFPWADWASRRLRRLASSADPSGRLRTSSRPAAAPKSSCRSVRARGTPPPRWRLRAGPRSRRRCSSSWRISPSSRASTEAAAGASRGIRATWAVRTRRRVASRR